MRLFVKEKAGIDEYRAHVEVVKNDGAEYLKECREFHRGDPIVFLSRLEEKKIDKKWLFMGGAFAQTSTNQSLGLQCIPNTRTIAPMHEND